MHKHMFLIIGLVLVVSGLGSIVYWKFIPAQKLPAQSDSRTAICITDQQQALAIAQRTVAALSTKYAFTVVENETIEKEFGWVFFYTTQAYLESGSPSDLVPGNGPFVVEKADGAVTMLPSSMTPDQAIAQFEAKWGASEKSHMCTNAK